MVKIFIKNNWQIIAINLLVLVCFTVFYGRFGNIIVDSFREAYIPSQMLEGQVLYKNIFSIYAPFAYLFNALLFLIFGVKLKVLYFAGFAATVAIVNFVFIISKYFTDKNCAFGIILFLIAGGILSPNVFNYFFPYSYGMLYGLLFILMSFWFGINKKFVPAFFMYSLSVCSKYEFICLLPLLIIAGRKGNWVKNIIALIIPPVMTFFPLFIQNAGIDNLFTSWQLVLEMASARTLYWFYSVTGLVFRWELIPIYLVNFVKVIVPLTVYYFFRKIWILPILLIYCYYLLSPEVLVYIFPLILILLIIRFTKIKNSERLFVSACLFVSAKVFFALTLLSYGVYFIPFALISIFILVPSKYRQVFVCITIVCAFSLGIKNTNALFNKDTKIESPQGIIYADNYYGPSVKEMVKYISESTNQDDKVIVYPECLAVNFFTDRSSDNKFYSLIPLYVEVFGDELIVKRLERINPEYVIIGNYDTSSYYYRTFGYDYADKVLYHILQNYDKQKEIGKGLVFTVFRAKTHHSSRMRV